MLLRQQVEDFDRLNKTFMASPTPKATAVVGVFSGMQNPEFVISGDELKQLAHLIAETVGKEAIQSPPVTRLGEYYGISVRADREAAALTRIPESFTVYKGVLSIDKGQQSEHWKDNAKVEDYLIQQAFRADYGNLLESFGIQSPPNPRG